MRLKNAFTVLAGIFLASGVGFAGRLPETQYSKSEINNRMFLDAHAPSLPPTYSRSEIKKLIHNAGTSEDFERLAEYFDYQAMEFEQKSQEQLKELQRLLALPCHARSYPVQLDYTRELIRRYRVHALECSARAETYRERAKVSRGETTESNVGSAK